MEPAIHGGHNLFAVTRDHVVPANRGGTRTFDNLVAACFLCNCYRRSMDAIKFWIFASGRWSAKTGKRSLSGLRGYALARAARGDPILEFTKEVGNRREIVEENPREEERKVVA
jgi:hypothetical protein